MTYQTEPFNTRATNALPNFDLTAVEVQALLADPTGHGLSKFLQEHAPHVVFHGQQLRTPYRILWYGENQGLTMEIPGPNNRKASQPVGLDGIVGQMNRAAEDAGRKTVSLSTVLNALPALARDLQKGFGLKLLINRQQEQIRLMSEAYAADLLENMSKDAERVFKRFNTVIQQAERVGANVPALCSSNMEIEKFRRTLTAAA